MYISGMFRSKIRAKFSRNKRNDFIIIDEYEYSMKMISLNSTPSV